MLGYATRIEGADLVCFMLEMKKQPSITDVVEHLICAYDTGESIEDYIDELRELI